MSLMIDQVGALIVFARFALEPSELARARA